MAPRSKQRLSNMKNGSKGAETTNRIIKLEKEKEQDTIKIEKLLELNRVMSQKLGESETRAKKAVEVSSGVENDLKAKDFVIQQKMSEIEVCKMKMDNIKNEMKEYKDHDGRLKEIIRTMRKKHVEELNIWCKKYNAVQKSLEMANKEIDQLKMQRPPKVLSLKDYNLIKDEGTRKDRFERLITFIENLVGKENVDRFISDFVRFVSSDRRFLFRLTLNPKESYYAAVEFRLSDGFLKKFKSLTNSLLRFDVFSSRSAISMLKKKNAPGMSYTIEVEQVTKETKNKKKITISSTFVLCEDVEGLLRRRLENLAKHQKLVKDDGTGSDIVLGFGGDKGGEVTKICLVLENTEKPNDPHTMLLLGWFSGNDNHENLAKRFGRVFDQLKALKTIDYEIDGQIQRDNVRIKLLGDCKFLSSLYGHSGQASTSPCYICDARWSKAGGNRATLSSFNFEKSGKILTLNDYKMNGNPLVDIEPSSAGPPGVHVFLGIFQYYFVEYLYAMCNMVDFKSSDLPENLKEQSAELEKLRSHELECLKSVSDLQDTLSVMKEVKEALERKQAHTRIRRRREEKCDSFCCVITDVDEKIKERDMKVCSECDSNFHSFCSLIFWEDQKIDAEKCLECSENKSITISERIEIIEKEMKVSQRELEKEEEYCGDVMEERELLEELLEKSSGPTRKKLEGMLRLIGCDVRTWYQQLTGNQVRTVLRAHNIDLILSIFKSREASLVIDMEKLELLRTTLYELAAIMSHSDNSVKSDDEIEELESTVVSFTENLRELFPNSTPTPKLHLLTAHLISYVKQYRSWGRVTEQGIESLHCVFRKLSERFISVRNLKMRAALILQEFANYNYISDCGESWKHNS